MSEDMLKKITLEINKHESLEDKELKIISYTLQDMVEKLL